MNPPELTERIAVLRAQRVPFVHARVVLAERPTSAKPGDEALILADGTMEGFVGGTCAETTVRAQALALLDSDESLVLRISPTPEPDRTGADRAGAQQSGRLVVHNPCLSGGTLEVFLEPVVPAPLVLVMGEAPVAKALRTFGPSLGYCVEPWALDQLGGASAVVVASHGRDEEETLRAALEAGVAYVGLVASPKRGKAVLEGLGLCASMSGRISTPAGLDIGARTPQEIALSILAEIVSRRPRPSARRLDAATASGVSAAPAGTATAIDPVCAMTVATVDSSLHLDHSGGRYWFCGSGCLRAFAAEPAHYLSVDA